MGRFFKALIVAAAATGVAYLVMSGFREQEEKLGGKTDRPRHKEIDADKLPADVKETLLAELEGQV